MSGFANPFAQFGEPSSGTNELVTTSYLTGLPDPKQITNEQVALIFRQLLKRDVRTKQRSLAEFESWLDNEIGGGKPIDDSVHLAYVQVYAKLALDNAAEIRILAHSVLGKLYKYLGKASSKFLKYSVGTWSTSRFDPEEAVARSCQQALDLVFPGEKQAILFDRMQDPVREYIYDSCTNTSAQTLSDVRLFSPEELGQKYTRLIKCCLDTLTSDPRLFDLNSEIRELVESGRAWKFISSGDSMLARSALRLAQAHVTDLEPWIGVLWKELLRTARKNAGGTGVALEVLQLMNVLTKKYPTEVWDPQDPKAREDAFASLAQFVISDPPHASRFWPLFYNLVLMVPQLDPQTELVVLYKPMEKTVVRQLKYNVELEESAWGCFVSLAGKMGPKLAARTFLAAEQRCNGPSVPVQAIAKFLSRLGDQPGVSQTVQTQLQQKNVPFDYVLILTQTQKFAELINTVIVPKLVASNEIDKLGTLVTLDPSLKVPNLTSEDDLSQLSEPAVVGWLQIAVNAQSAQPQVIVDALLKSQVSPLTILRSAVGLSRRNVAVDLNSFIDAHDRDVEVLSATVAAHDTNFVTSETAVMALNRLVKIALNDEEKLGDLTRTIKNNAQFVDAAVASDKSLGEDLEILAADDRRGVIRSLSNLHVAESHQVEAHAERGAVLDLQDWDLDIPAENCVNPLRAPIPETTNTLEEGLVDCETLAELALGIQHQEDTESQCTLAIVNSYLLSWLLVMPAVDRNDMPTTNEFVATHVASKSPAVSQRLWDMLESNSAVAYHAAQALLQHGPPSGIEFSRDFFSKTPLRGAILSYFSAVQDMRYDQMQRALVKDAVMGRLAEKEYMLIDRSFIPDSATLLLDDEEQPSLTVKAVNTFTTKVSNLTELALQSANREVEYAAVLALPASAIDLETVLELATSLPDSGSGMDKQYAQKCLHLAKQLVDAGSVGADDLDSLSDTIDFQALLDRSDLIEIPWICLVLPEVSPHLQLQLSGESPSTLVSWLLLLQLGPEKRPEINEKDWQQMWRWISRNLDFDLKPSIDLDVVPSQPLTTPELALLLLYGLAKHFPNQLRFWYRDLRDRTFVKRLDQLFATRITPAVMRNLKHALETHPPSAADHEEIELTVTERQREVRATREIEDEFTVEVVISLPEQFPCKPPNISINNLAGVSEAKKRGWLLEARHHVQDGGVEAALSSVLTRLNNFLEGVEPCAICYMTVNDLNKLPNKSCSNCHNIYHSECLYKWFTTNTNNRLCPVCRSPM